MFGEKVERTFVSNVGERFVVLVGRRVVGERMGGSLVPMQLERLAGGAQPPLECVLGLGVREALDVVGGAEMHLQRGACARHVAQLAARYAVEGHGRRETVDERRGRKRQCAAHAEPNNADLLDAFRLEIANRALDVLHGALPVQAVE